MNGKWLPKAKNVTAQLFFEAKGNPPSTRPDSAISNCFPGLEFDFRNIWRRVFDGIEMNEADNLVVAADKNHKEFEALRKLVGHRLLYVDHQSTFVRVNGPRVIGGPENEQLSDNTNGTWVMEWSNGLAEVLRKSQARSVVCWFTTSEVGGASGIVGKRRKGHGLTPAGKVERMPEGLVGHRLRVKSLFVPDTAVIAESMVRPGELTQSLCSPWQNDYKECACYYWAASRPDYVNTEIVGPGESIGNSWLAKRRDPKEYIADDSSRLWSYDELFQDWQARLKFIIGGRDAD
jgi:hypothetical protein